MTAPSILAFCVVYIRRFIMVIGRDDWLRIWIGLEVNIVRFIILIFKRGDVVKREGIIKYFFIQRVGSRVFLGIFYLDGIMEILGPIILTYKIGGGPFYYWFPRLCESASWGVCIILMTFQKLIPLVLVRMMLRIIVILIRIVRVLVGGIGIINQKKLKRLIAYSSIYHVGLLLLRVTIWEKFWVLYLFIYIMIIIAVVMAVWEKEEDRIEMIIKKKVDWKFFFRMLRIAGIPPLLGFFLKWILFYWLLWRRVILLIFLVLISVLIFYIYVRVLYDVVFLEKIEGSWILRDVKGGLSEVITIIGIILGPIIIYLLI